MKLKLENRTINGLTVEEGVKRYIVPFESPKGTYLIKKLGIKFSNKNF